MKRIAVQLTLTEEAKRIAKKQSEIFGGNLSAYITHLILNAEKEKSHSQNVEYNNENGIQITAPVKKAKITNKVKK